MTERKQTQKVSVSIDNRLLHWLDSACEGEHTNRSRYINRLIVNAMSAGGFGPSPLSMREPQANYGSNVNNGGKSKKEAEGKDCLDA